MFCPPFYRERIRPYLLNYAKMSDIDSWELAAKYEVLGNEYQICRHKLESKNEALLILSKELDECRCQRDQFKLMAEQLRERYQGMKRQLAGHSVPSLSFSQVDPCFYSDMQSQNLVKLVCDTKEHNKSLQFELDDLKQKLQDAQGDIKLLREQIVRQRVGTTDEGINTRHFPAYEREDLVKQLEAAMKEYAQLERDLQQVLDEKQDQEMERDGYKMKYDRLNQELNYILKGDENRIVDIDALATENKYLQERLKQLEEEKAMAMQTASKYKSMLEKKKNKGILKLGQSRSGGLVITQKQVHQMLENRTGLPVSQQAMADLQGLCSALLETINDKSLALSHQRKTNKILGNRISELEKKLKTLEVSGLWNIPAHAPYLAKLQAECAEMKMLVPRQMSQSSDASDKTRDILAELDSDISSITSPDTSPTHRPHPTATPNTPSIGMDDLDLLPTKENSGKTHTDDFQHQNSDNLNHLNFNLQCCEETCDIPDENTSNHTDHNEPDLYRHSDTNESITDFIEDVTAKMKNFSHITETSPFYDSRMGLDKQPLQPDGIEPAESDRIEPAETDHIEPAESDRIEPAETDRIEPAETDRIEPAESDRIEPDGIEPVDSIETDALLPVLTTKDCESLVESVGDTEEVDDNHREPSHADEPLLKKTETHNTDATC